MLQKPSHSFTLQTLLESLSNNSLEVTAKFSKSTLDVFDRKLKESGVLTKLRDYQLKGVLWMLEREKGDNCIKLDINEVDTHTKCDDKMTVILNAMLKARPDGWACFPLPQIDTEVSYAYTHAHGYIYLYMYIYIYIYTCTYKYKHTYIHTYKRLYFNLIFTYIYTT